MKRTWLALLALTLIALALRVYQLDMVSLRGDEAFTVVFVQRTWEGLWKGIRTVEPNPPLLYLALRAWVAVAGAGEFATRYFSAFFGVLCVPLLYRLAREIFQNHPLGSRMGLGAALVIAINPYQIWHSQDVRNYTLWPALSLVSLILFWRWWNYRDAGAHDWSRRRWALLGLYILATTASLYTHYYDTFILVAENVFVFAVAIVERRWGTLARWIGAQVTLAVVYLPWVLFGTNRVTTYGEPSAKQSVPLVDQFTSTLSTFVVGDTFPDWKMLLWPPLLVALAAGLMYVTRQNRWWGVFLFVYIVVPTLALYAISIGRPLFLERYLNGVAPAYYLIFGAGLAALVNYGSRRRILPSGLAALCLLFILSTSALALSSYYWNPTYAKAPDWRALARYIAARQQPGDMIVQNFTEMAAIYYLNGSLPLITLPKDYSATPEDARRLEQLNQDYERLWFIPAAPDYWDDVHFVENYLSRYDDRIIDTRVASFRLQLYATPRQFVPKIIPVNARVGKATLVGYRIDGQGKETAGPAELHVVLYWRAESKIDHDYAVFVHLADTAERVVAQQDRTPVGGTWPTSAWQPGELIVDGYDLKANLAPGTWPLFIGMYDSSDLARVPAFDANGAPLPNNRIPLTQVTVVP